MIAFHLIVHLVVLHVITYALPVVIPLDDEAKAAILKKHNDERESILLGTGGSDYPKAQYMPPLVWDDELVATSLVDNLKCKWAHLHTFPMEGENLAYTSLVFTTDTDSADIVWQVAHFADLWLGEKGGYDYALNNCSIDMCGHYLQMIYADTRKIGCSLVSQCAKPAITKLSCHYDLGRLGRPYYPWQELPEEAVEDQCLMVECNQYGSNGNGLFYRQEETFVPFGSYRSDLLIHYASKYGLWVLEDTSKSTAAKPHFLSWCTSYPESSTTLTLDSMDHDALSEGDETDFNADVDAMYHHPWSTKTPSTTQGNAYAFSNKPDPYTCTKWNTVQSGTWRQVDCQYAYDQLGLSATVCSSTQSAAAAAAALSLSAISVEAPNDYSLSSLSFSSGWLFILVISILVYGAVKLNERRNRKEYIAIGGEDEDEESVRLLCQ